MVAFLSGTLVGGMAGIVTMCLLQINRLYGCDFKGDKAALPLSDRYHRAAFFIEGRSAGEDGGACRQKETPAVSEPQRQRQRKAVRDKRRNLRPDEADRGTAKGGGTLRRDSRTFRRKKREFQDLGYICCSTLVRARSKGFHCRYYKQLLAENGLPDIRWHDLRSTYCTLLLKESFNPKAVSKLMGHAKELITMDVYADNRGIIADGVPEIEEYMKEVLPNPEETEIFKKELLEIVVDVTEFLPDAV